jgi:hypothetical protein
MADYNRTEYLARATIWGPLSEQEIARVRTEETASQLEIGDEYVDLEVPDRDILQAPGGATPPMGKLLPRKAVHERTWLGVFILLCAHRHEGTPPHTRGA